MLFHVAKLSKTMEAALFVYHGKFVLSTEILLGVPTEGVNNFIRLRADFNSNFRPLGNLLFLC